MARRFLLDVRYALRVHRRSPGFASVAVLVLALAIGVNTASFGLVDALLFKPLPVPDPDRLVRVAATAIDGGVSHADILDYRSGARSLSGLAAFTIDRLEYRPEGSDDTERVAACLVTDDYFEVLGVGLALGRGLIAAGGSEAPGVVLSDAFWRTRFAADPAVVGRNLWLNRASFTVVGVAPPHFTGTFRGAAPHLFVPYSSQVSREELLARERRGLIAIGRLAPGATVEAAQAELGMVARRLSEAHPRTNRGIQVRVGPERTAPFREVPPLAYVVVAVLGMFALVLLVACVNLAGLLTARSTFRQREIAVRAMLGASRRALVGQLLTESLVLAFMGGVGGLFVGAAARQILGSRLQSAVADQLGVDAVWIDPGVDARVALYTLAITAGSVLLFGLIPARHASRQDLYGHAKSDPSSPTPAHVSRLRFLVAAQVTLSAVLLAGAGLLVQSVRQATSADLGYPLDRSYVADLSLPGADNRQASPAFDRVLARARELPGVEAAALGGTLGPAFLPASVTPGRPRQNYVFSVVGSGLFATMRIPMLAGREFDDRDTGRSAPVVILNQKLAEALWPGQDPIGRPLVVWEDRPALTVVGLARTVRSFPLGPPFFQLYVPLAQHELTSATLHLRAAPGQGETLRRRLPVELRALRLGLASVRVRSLEEWVGSVLAVPQALVAALGWLGVLGLFLAAVGLYGVTAYIAGRRARECALRQVLGASRLSILRLLVGGAMGTVLAGLGAGVGLSLAVGWLLKDAFLGASFDPLALVAAPVALAATALLAVTLPVVQTGAREPMNLLREE